MVPMSRRHLFGSLATAAAASLLPLSLHRAMAAPMRRGGLAEIEHVVLLMQENRSFDHYYGTLRGVRGFGDESPLRLRTGRSVFHQPQPAPPGQLPAPAAEVLPFSLRAAAARAGRPDSDIQYLDALNHEWYGSTAAWAQGWYDGWIPAKTPATMTYYERRDIPLQYELAETFTLCDAYHCSLFGGTNPNRNYFFTGTTGFEPGTRKRAVANDAYEIDHPGYAWTTYPERLEAAGVSWQIYQEWDNFTDNPVEYFLPFKRIGTRLLAEVDGGYRTTEQLYTALLTLPEADRQRLLGQLDAALGGLTAQQRSLFDRAMYRSAPGTLLQRFRADVTAGTLPAVTWLVPPQALSEHPSGSTPVASANLIYDLLDILASDPGTWSKTALFLNFDENDGFFDHVPPPVPPRPADGEGDDWYQGQAIGLGPRVPMVVVSPWTIGGFVDSEVFDHTSVLRFLETWTGVAEPNISTWRRTACGDLTSAFDFTDPGRPPTLHRPGPVPAPVTRWMPNPPPAQSVPEQEPGRRPARALPYQPTVSAVLRSPTRLAVTLRNSGARPAHFTVYSYAGEPSFPVHLDVAYEATEIVTVAGEYDIAVQGPNRFWHELRGNTSGAAADIVVRQLIRRGSLSVDLANGGGGEVTVTLSSRRFTTTRHEATLLPGTTKSVDWPTDDGWYDLTVTCAEDPTFSRRLTGRIEPPAIEVD
ncbi:phospholipase C [Nocardia vulneris]|uniref:phospholipase C n=2 Tax=Nocardia vulneris TaxID=1141657 RepID=A0ABR4Z712_9NOCA|nr:phospholipase C [Nocardia vulneris]